jgi:hypothetical protein
MECTVYRKPYSMGTHSVFWSGKWGDGWGGGHW